VNLARATLKCRCHVCAFFHRRDDEYDVMLPFIKEGIEVGDRAVYILDKHQRAERLNRLRSSGVDVGNAQGNGQLEFRLWEEAHLNGGRFDACAMLTLVEDIAKAGMQCGTGITRLWVNMEPAIGSFHSARNIVEYESGINLALSKYDLVMVCTYDTAKFSPSVMLDILRTHPQVILGGILQENPFYVPPGEILGELAGQQAPVHRAQ
jgi:hypothetical protein